MGRKLVIAIDGPAGAGKSTVARLLADRLGYLYIDTGAMYRAVTLAALRAGLDLTDSQALAALTAGLDITLVPGDACRAPGCLLGGADVSEEIRSPEVTRLVSLTSRVPEVREHLVRRQRAMAGPGGVVMDGRDIGSQVLPGADHKFFLTASLEERARRRLLELRQKGLPAEHEAVKREIAARDDLDRTREVAPLLPAPDAVVIDSTSLSPAAVVELIVEHLARGQGEEAE